MSDKNTFAFVFPGQGSQSVGMLKALGAAYSVVEETFQEASQILGIDLWSLVQEGPEEALNRTEVTQPALLAADVACYRAWRASGGPAPDMMAGHSLGEYAALVCSGSVVYGDAVRLVAERGRLMQRAVPEGFGAMAAVLGLPDPDVEALCRLYAEGEVLSAVNYNAPGQVVIAGTRAAVDRAVAGAKAAGAKRALMLSVSVPSHCALMKEAADAFAAVLSLVPFKSPVIPVIHNFHVEPLSEADSIRDALVKQLFSPVRWVETIHRMVSLGATLVVECGPGKILTGLNKRIVDCSCLTIGEPADFAAAASALRS